MELLIEPDSCVDAVALKVGKDWRLAAPLGAGKPNHLLNAFYRRAKEDSEIQLTIYTALTLERPKGKSELESRFLDPMVERVFGNYPDLDFELDRMAGTLPANVRVVEFYFPAGKFKSVPSAQRDYISSNYTHVARDLIGRGVNILVQQVAWDDSSEMAPRVSLSCNADVTLDLMAALEGRADVAFVAMTNDELPFMFGDAVLDADRFHYVVRNPDLNYRIFGPPKMSVPDADYMIGLYASTLIRDGGELQVGIGSLGDAIVYGLCMRHEENETYLRILRDLKVFDRTGGAVLESGDLDPFEEGLFAASEMMVDGFMQLYQAGVIRRRVYDHLVIQSLLGEGLITEDVNVDMLRALIEHRAVHVRMAQEDYDFLVEFGIFREGLEFCDGEIRCEDGKAISADLSSDQNLERIAECCLGTHLRGGAVIHAGFFLGPAGFYQWLRELPKAERELIHMRSVARINQLYGHEEIDRLQRPYARFVNTAMMMTLLGAAVSDGLEDGTVISGVGGQYNFVAMAHALPDGRSILQVRSTHRVNGELRSSIVWNYGHVTIPRHLRDIVITEYGIADLRGRTDSEVIKALLAVTDSRFQGELVATAKRANKLEADYQIPERYRNNTPESYALPLKALKAEGLFPLFPFGTDFTDEEVVLGGALKRLKKRMGSSLDAVEAVADAVAHGSLSEQVRPYLERMGLANPESLKEKLYQRLLVAELKQDPRVSGSS